MPIVRISRFGGAPLALLFRVKGYHRVQKIFQIGFNKTATSALFFLFVDSGYKALHSGGRYWRQRKHPQIVNTSPQIVIRRNIKAGVDPLTGLDDFTAFFDMENVSAKRIYEGYRYFKTFHSFHPTAKFILNVRDVDDWLRSRTRHADGQYLTRYMQHLNTDAEGVQQAWRKDFLDHTQAVTDFFADKPGQLLRFDIDRDPISDLVAFCKPDYQLNPEKWRHVRVTDAVAAKKDWSV